MIEKILEARPRDVAGFSVGRVLPAYGKALVGPFIFFDHMGPNTLAPGHGMDVPPHPHIGLATVTYLFQGEAHHRDSTGASQIIRPGDINWMTAGRGVVHSERTPPEARARGGEAHGLQLWVALPKEHEEMAPTFQHHSAETLPTVHHQHSTLRVLAGSAYGVRSPVQIFSELFYVEVSLKAGDSLPLPAFEERAAYLIEGSIWCDEAQLRPRQMAIFSREGAPMIRAERDSRLVLLGGAPLSEPRFIWWNFVASSQELIDRAKIEWRERRFPVVPGDEVEFVPLPTPR